MDKKPIITDLFKNIIYNNNNVDFILIHIYINPEDYLIKLDETDHCCVWEPNINKIIKIFESHKLNHNIFSSLGNLWYKTKKIQNKIIIIYGNINSNIITYPVDYIIEKKYGNGFIWKPVGHPKYSSIGLIYSKTKPNINLIGLIKTNYLISYKGLNVISDDITNMNEFNLLSVKNIKKITLDKKKIMFQNNLSKSVKQNKKITAPTNNNKNIYQIDNKNIKYTTQGEIKMDEPLQPISENKNNISYLNGDNTYNLIINKNDLNKKSKIEPFQSNDIKWKNKKGNILMLIESVYPWYKDNLVKIDVTNPVTNAEIQNLNKIDNDVYSKSTSKKRRNSRTASYEKLLKKSKTFIETYQNNKDKKTNNNCNIKINNVLFFILLMCMVILHYKK
jgi:hypothetical protein